MTSMQRRQTRNLQLTLLMTVAAVLLLIVLFIQLSSNTVKGSKSINLHYVSVEINAQDTIWDLATTFNNDDYYTIEEYIKEIIRINGLKSETIYTGQRLTLPIIENDFASN